MKDLWYHNAIIYALDVETYMDSNGNGIGDFEGLVEKLDYLSGLGVNCLWLRPFFPSPLVDDGYDVKDYYNVDQRFGNLGDFVNFTTKATTYGIRVIIDLVANHTSDQHEWFQQARMDVNSKYRNYYIWADKPLEEYKQENILKEEGIWHFDKQAGAYYLHHFYKEQPDLNISNPEVRKEIKKIMGFWLKLGISGFRIDAAHILIREIGNEKINTAKVLDVLDEMREFINSRNSEAVLLAEANVKVDELHLFFGNGKRMHLLFDFITNKNLFLAMAREDPQPLISALNNIRGISGQWVNFLRHHDELNLEMLEESQRNEVFEAFAPEQDMRIYGHGIRRRLPPMLNGDRKKMELIYSVMFSLPGIPLINYGEEIAMGDDLSQKGRSSVRTIMQWDNLKNSGFSKAPALMLEHSLIDFGEFDYKKINVNEQQNNPDSFLNWMQRLISTRKQCPQLGYGQWRVLESDTKSVFSFYCEYEKDRIVLLHNFKGVKCDIKLDGSVKKFENLIEIFSNRKYPTIETLNAPISIDEYGYRWFKCNAGFE
ncbi:MAG: alpha-amylase family protein [Bacteroidetes bacterium]|nr:alpha-amylase family protein [Bacteroidota bacterium]HET6243714.1 alpha-amylase family protein [Bacteroidia bacterium]